MTDDTPLAVMWRQLRMLRLADGPDEVHKRVIAKRELNKWKAGDSAQNGKPAAPAAARS
jgi:acyl-CoA dehydrogenase